MTDFDFDAFAADEFDFDAFEADLVEGDRRAVDRELQPWTPRTLTPEEIEDFCRHSVTAEEIKW